MKESLTKATVYRVVATGGQNKLGQLIAVVSPNPGETINMWLKHASVGTIEDPVLVPNLDGTAPGIDHIIQATDKSPYYTVVNRLEQSSFERILIHRD